MSDNDSGLGGAAATILVMGLAYWIAMGIVMLLLLAFLGAVAAIVTIVWFILEADKPSWRGALVWISGTVPLVSLPFIVMRFAVLGPDWSYKSTGFDEKSVISLACFGGLIGAIYLSYMLYEWCIYRFD